MKVRIGDKIMSEYGKGEITAITRQWVVHEIEDGSEVAVGKDEVWIKTCPDFSDEPDSILYEMEVE